MSLDTTDAPAVQYADAELRLAQLSDDGFVLSELGVVSKPAATEAVAEEASRKPKVVEVDEIEVGPQLRPEPQAPEPTREHTTVGKDEAFFWLHADAPIIEKAILERMTVLLVGPTGCGKTTLFELLLAKHARSFYHMSLHGEMSVDDFFGSREIRNGQTVFHFAPTSQAMIDKVPLIINELDAAPPEILFCLQRPLERKDVVLTCTSGSDGRPLRLDPWNDGQSTTAQGTFGPYTSQFDILATANTIGRGDDTGLYRGTNTLNEAFLDRFDLVLFLDYPPESHEVSILTNRLGIDERTATKIVDVANMARKAFNKDRSTMSTTFSVRKALNWAKVIKRLGLSPEHAFKITVADRAPNMDKVRLVEFFNRVFGSTTLLASLLPAKKK